MRRDDADELAESRRRAIDAVGRVDGDAGGTLEDTRRLLGLLVLTRSGATTRGGATFRGCTKGRSDAAGRARERGRGPRPMRCGPVIVCTHNRGPLIEETLESLVAQDFPAAAFEIVIVDNASSDAAPAVLQTMRAPKRGSNAIGGFIAILCRLRVPGFNMIEHWFRDLTDKQIRRGVFKSVADLIAAIQAYVEHHNSNPKPFVWTGKAEDIMPSIVALTKAVLDKVQTA